MEDVLAVLDAAGSDRAALLGHSEGGNLAVLFAASHPERTIALVTAGIFAKRIWSPDYPWAPKREERERYLQTVEAEWGQDADVEHLAPSAARDEAFASTPGDLLPEKCEPGRWSGADPDEHGDRHPRSAACDQGPGTRPAPHG